MRAMVLYEFGAPLVWERVSDPICGPEDVIIEVAGCGVCATDLKIIAGDVPGVSLPHIPGHEIAGIVVEIGSRVRGIERGQATCAHFYVPCGRCKYCAEGRTTLCSALIRIGFNWDGGYAQYVRVPSQVLIPVPSDVDLEALCIAADAIATPLHALRRRAEIQEGWTVLILGAAGGLGLHAIQIAKLQGANVVAVDRGAERLRAAAEAGADEWVDTEVEEEWRALLERGPFVHAVIDLAGSPEAGSAAYGLLRSGGRYVAIGYRYGVPFLLPYQQTVSRELEFVGSRAATLSDVEEAVRLVLEGKIRPMVADRVPLYRANEALARLRQGSVVGRLVLIPTLSRRSESTCISG